MTEFHSVKTKLPVGAASDSKVAEAIGRALKHHYADLVDTPLPKKLVELLARFEARDGAPEERGTGDAVS
jgi:Anti-sigma factor NepR